MISNEVCVIIRSRRPPPIVTIQRFAMPKGFQVFVQADPSVYQEHRDYYAGEKDIRVVRGVAGLSAQSHRCYLVAAEYRFPWYFRLDDDLTEGYFVHKDGSRPGIRKALTVSYRAALALKTSLVGFAKTSNRFWMKPGAGRAYGLIHGGAALFKSTRSPDQYIDPTLPLYDDVWQSLSHRADSRAVGRVREIGLDLIGSAKTVTEGHDRKKLHHRSRDRILETFPGYATCDGDAFLDKWGKYCLPWKFHRHEEFSARVPE